MTLNKPSINKTAVNKATSVKRPRKTAQPKKVTVYSLANEAGVSPATISKVLKNAPDVSAEVRERVLKLAKQHNFQPRQHGEDVCHLCVLIEQIDGHSLDFSGFLSQVLEGASTFAVEQGVSLSIHARHHRELEGADLLRQFRQQRVSAVLALRVARGSTYLDELEQGGIPCVRVLTDDHPSSLSVSVDHYAIGREAANVLMQYGHHRVGVLATPAAGSSAQARLAGFREAYQAGGTVIPEGWIRWPLLTQNGYEFGSDAARQVTAAFPEITALFTMDQAVAVGAIHSLRGLGRSVPGEISVISCDDYPETAYLSPPLTSVAVPNRHIGYVAARLAAEAAAGRNPAAPALMQPEVIMRQSIQPRVRPVSSL